MERAPFARGESQKAPTTLLEVLLEADPSERICYGCGYAYLVESLMSVLGNALSPIATKLEGQADLQEQVRDAQRIAFEYRALFKAHRLAMTDYVRAAKASADAARRLN